MFRRFFLSERNMMALISINALVICFLYFPEFENNGWIRALDNLFIALFVVEAIVKMHTLKPKGYFANDWNRFDFTIVLFSLPSIFESILPIPETSLLLILRLFRLVRLIRFIRFVPHIGMITAGLGRALKSLVFVLMALFFINFMLALVTCHFFRDLAPEYFQDPLVSAYSIFQMFTVEGWNEIPATIASRTDNSLVVGATRMYFVFVVLVCGIFGMSLANAIFVDEMTFDNNRALEEKMDVLAAEIRELKQLLNQEPKNLDN